MVLTTVMVTLPQVSLAVGGSKSQALPHSTVLSGLQAIVGAVLSSTRTVWLHSTLSLPQASVAFHVRVALKVLPQWPVVLVIVLTMLMVTLPQVSLAVGGSKSHALPHSAVLSGLQAMVGGVVSSTCTVCLQSVWLPQA